MSATDGADAFDVLDFWWSAGPAKWFTRDDEFDASCRDRLGGLHEAAAAGELDAWKQVPHTALARIILLDQVPRNIHRGSPKSWATDPLALAAAEEALERRYPQAFPVEGKMFFYLPFMHAEDMASQTRSVDLYRALGVKDPFHYALLHLDAIARFGRFPHRNAVLGRETTPEEAAYMAAGGFSA